MRDTKQVWDNNAYLIDYDSAPELMERSVRTPILNHLITQALVITSLLMMPPVKLWGLKDSAPYLFPIL
jgi:hypothetical protein